jgi:hypothetical protein
MVAEIELSDVDFYTTEEDGVCVGVGVLACHNARSQWSQCRMKIRSAIICVEEPEGI